MTTTTEDVVRLRRVWLAIRGELLTGAGISVEDALDWVEGGDRDFGIEVARAAIEAMKADEGQFW